MAKEDNGIVYLIGAGPGDTDLLTLRAKNKISSCDVILYDNLVHRDILDFADKKTEIIFVGKEAGQHTTKQEAIQEILVKKAKLGLKVVRLKGGDPFIFGRGGEEALYLKNNGVYFEIIPAVTAAIGASAYAGIPLTQRGVSSSVCFLTGHQDPKTKSLDLDFVPFAKAGGTLCIYMGMLSLDRIIEQLRKGGVSTDTPIAIVQWATHSKQITLISNIGAVVQEVTEAQLSAPSIIIIGEVVNLRCSLKWIEKKPLWGKRIAVTRNQPKSHRLYTALKESGAEVLEIPTITIKSSPSKSLISDIWNELARYEWIVFTSCNGVEHFFHHFYKRFTDLRCLGPMRVACIGKSTEKALNEQHIEVDILPEDSNVEALSEALLKNTSLENTMVLLIQGNRNDPILAQRLEKDGGAIVDSMQLYETHDSIPKNSENLKSFVQKGADCLIFTSASAVESFARQASLFSLESGASKPVIASLGPKTTETIKKKGLSVAIESPIPNIDNLTSSIIDYFCEK